MSNMGLFEGLSEGFGLLGQSVLKQQDRAQEEAMLEKKMQLQKQISMDLMKAKYDYMAQNPSYKHFATDLEGNIIAFDMFGKPSVVHESSPEEKTLRLQKARGEAAKAQNAADKDESDQALAAAKTDYYKKRTSDPQAFMRPAGAGRSVQDPYAKTSDELETMATKAAAAAYPGGTEAWQFATPEKRKPYIDAATKHYTDAGYRLVQPGQTKQMPAGGGLAAPSDSDGAGVFTHLVPSGDDSDGSDDEDYDPTED